MSGSFRASASARMPRSHQSPWPSSVLRASSSSRASGLGSRRQPPDELHLGIGKRGAELELNQRQQSGFGEWKMGKAAIRGRFLQS
jgi:hypothetical protein